MHPHIADILKGIFITILCIPMVVVIVAGLLAWRNWAGPARPDPENEVWGDVPHWPKERQ